MLREAAPAPTHTDRIVEVTSTPTSQIPEQTLLAARRVLADTIAVALGGSTTSLAEPVLALTRTEASAGPATILCGNLTQTASLTGATYANAHLANILDADETILNRSHYAAAIVPAALAVAQQAHASGAELVAAVAAATS